MLSPVDDATKGRMLGATEVRRILGISEATYFRWLGSGRLEGVKVGRRWRFDPRTIELLVRPEAAEAETADLMAAVELCRARRHAVATDDQGGLEMQETMTGDAAEVARLLVEHAVGRQASDVHLDPDDAGVIVRERVAGLLETVDPPLPAGARRAVVRAFKEMAGLDTSVETQGQVGHVVTRVGGRRVDLRVSTFPSSLGEALSIRLPPQTKHHSMEDLAYSEHVMTTVRDAVGRRPFGLVLTAGPTGSGKSTAMYALLREVMTPERRVMTAESSVVFHVEGALQATTSPDFTTADALRAMFDADVDVALASDLETQEEVRLATELAKTGHLVLSQVHAADAAGAVHSLLRVGALDPELVIETLNVLVAQRLVPRSCPSCRTTRKLSAAEADELGLVGAARRQRVATNPGCDECKGRGTLGRLAVVEVLTMTPALAAGLRAPEVTPDSLRAALGPDFASIAVDIRRRLAEGHISAETALAHISGTFAPFTPSATSLAAR